MTQKVITKKSFIGGRMVYPGELVDVDEKGAVLPAPSTPVGQMTDDQLEAILAQRKKVGKPDPEAPKFGGNVADPDDTNTGTQPAEFARIRPGSGDRPQVLPAGTIEHNNRFIRPASEDAPAAVEEIVAPGASDTVVTDAAPGAFDHDGDGAAGGSKAGDPVALSGKNKAALLEVATAENVTIAKDSEGIDIPVSEATNAQIVDAIEAGRA